MKFPFSLYKKFALFCADEQENVVIENIGELISHSSSNLIFILRRSKLGSYIFLHNII